MIVCFLILLVLFVIIIAFIIIKRQYSYNCLLRLDPLELEKLRKINTQLNRQLWILGDSRAEHWNVDFVKLSSHEIINRGISAQTSKQVLERFKCDITVKTPDWIILQVGINDFKMLGLNTTLNSGIGTDCFNNIVTILELCMNNNIRIIFTPVLILGSIELLRKLIWNANISLAIEDLNKKLENYCLLHRIIFYNINEVLCNKNGRVKKEYQNGFLHLNDNAYKIMSARLIEKYGSELIG
jgi:lysophospholipase L1-like esterase